MPWSEMDNGPGLSARPWPCPFTSGAQFKLDNASSGQFPAPTATTHLKGQSLLSGASACCGCSLPLKGAAPPRFLLLQRVGTRERSKDMSGGQGRRRMGCGAESGTGEGISFSP